MKYLLMNKDNVVATFELVGKVGFEYYKVKEVFGKLPYNFSNVSDWLVKRQSAKHREHIKTLMKECGCDTIEGYIKIMHCTSINDTMWVKKENEDVMWRDVSLYTNEFNEVISKLAFKGVGLFGEQFTATSPEFGTAGAYSKCCTKGIDGDMFMYKRGTTGFANSGLEPYCETFSSPIYSIITENSVIYNLVKLHGIKSSKCKIFTDERIGLAPYHDVGSGYSVGECMDFYDKLDSSDKFRAMLVADAVCFNEDRHSGNHGVLINNDTLDIIGMSPVYDNNLSMLPYAMPSDFNDIEKYMSEHNTRLGTDWVSAARAALTSELRITLINLQGYKIDFDGDEKYTKERVLVMNKMVNQQIKNILGKGDIYGYTGIRSWDNDKAANAKKVAETLLGGSK